MRSTTDYTDVARHNVAVLRHRSEGPDLATAPHMIPSPVHRCFSICLRTTGLLLPVTKCHVGTLVNDCQVIFFRSLPAERAEYHQGSQRINSSPDQLCRSKSKREEVEDVSSCWIRDSSHLKETHEIITSLLGGRTTSQKKQVPKSIPEENKFETHNPLP